MAQVMAKSAQERARLGKCTIKAGWGTQTTSPVCYDLCVALMQSVRDTGDEGAVAKLKVASPNGWHDVVKLHR